MLIDFVDGATCGHFLVPASFGRPILSNGLILHHWKLMPIFCAGSYHEWVLPRTFHRLVNSYSLSLCVKDLFFHLRNISFYIWKRGRVIYHNGY